MKLLILLLNHTKWVLDTISCFFFLLIIREDDMYNAYVHFNCFQCAYNDFYGQCLSFFSGIHFLLSLAYSSMFLPSLPTFTNTTVSTIAATKIIPPVTRYAMGKK